MGVAVCYDTGQMTSYPLTLPWKETLLAQRRSNALTGVRTNSYAQMNSYFQSVHIHQPKNCIIFSNTFELVNSSSQSGLFHQPKSSQILDSIGLGKPLFSTRKMQVFLQRKNIFIYKRINLLIA